MSDAPSGTEEVVLPSELDVLESIDESTLKYSRLAGIDDDTAYMVAMAAIEAFGPDLPVVGAKVFPAFHELIVEGVSHPLPVKGIFGHQMPRETFPDLLKHTDAFPMLSGREE